MDIVLRWMDQSAAIKKVILAVGYMADKIISRYENANAFSFSIAFSVEEQLLGTGGAIKKALRCSDADHVFALNGDSYVELDLNAMFSAHLQKKADMTIALKEVPDAGRYGRVVMGSGNRLMSFEEKKDGLSGGYINAGVYLIRRSLFENVEDEKSISLERELLPGFLNRPVYGFITSGKFIDIGIPETYKISGDYLRGDT